MADDSDVFQGIVTLEGDRLVTDSRRVAKAFGKRHDNVLRDIHAMRDNDEAEIREHYRLNFEETVETRPSPLGGVIPSVAYRMTKDGFAELAMSFTGNKARIIRIRFLAAFNAMAEYIARREQTLWQQMVELNAQDAASEARASFGSHLMLQRRKALPEFEARRLRLSSRMQLPLALDP
ncbi:Rha family transcriptional regulator [Burkholderia pseudomallei]|uniref:Rha family transcriptional regulator n=1 Tax=Burkholderia pseudomallei TaxID=28450 RepID=UPI000F0618E5|nr:Rha family transcriptional regulator [Burkholderia pseudomallei]VBO15442.1 putative bacteriophage protein [Burkholderia pseudomallei]